MSSIAFGNLTGHTSRRQRGDRAHPASDDVLESGMVFNVEPAVYGEGWGGIRQCELVAVGPHGVELLTPFQATLDALAPRLAAY